MILGRLLRIGVMVAGAVVLIGGLIYLIHHGMNLPGYGLFRGEPSDLRSVTGIFRDTAFFQGRGIIQMGFLILILTPVVRVAFSIYAFFRHRDRIYVLVTTFVLAVLLFSLIGGHI
jgi:uncharacterized membrane protein